LILALEHLSLAARYDDSSVEQQTQRIQYLEDRFRARYGAIGKVAEAFAQAWRQVGSDKNALLWYERAVRATDGSASFEAGAEWARVRARVAWERFSGAQGNGATPGPSAGIGEACMSEAREAARLLEGLGELRPSVKLATLCGSAWRRLAKMQRRMAQGNDIPMEGINKALSHFDRALTLSRDARSDALFLPALKYLSASVVQSLWMPEGLENEVKAEQAKRSSLIPEIRYSLSQRMQRRTDFWCHAALNGIQICEAIDKKALATVLSDTLSFYEKLHATADAAKFWTPVYYQADFVLSNYLDCASDTEKKAADTLADALSKWGGVNRPAACQGATASQITSNASVNK